MAFATYVRRRIVHRRTARQKGSYKPLSRECAQCERCNGTLETRVQRFLFTYRSTPHATTGRTPAEMLTGRRFRTRLDCMRPSVQRNAETAAQRDQYAHDTHAKFREFLAGDAVSVRWYTGHTKWRGGIIMRRTGPLSYDVRVGGDVVTRHIAQLMANRKAISHDTAESEADAAAARMPLIEPSIATDVARQPAEPASATPDRYAETAVRAEEPTQETASDTEIEATRTRVTTRRNRGNTERGIERPERPSRMKKAPSRYEDEYSTFGSKKPARHLENTFAEVLMRDPP